LWHFSQDTVPPGLSDASKKSFLPSRAFSSSYLSGAAGLSEDAKTSAQKKGKMQKNIGKNARANKNPF